MFFFFFLTLSLSLSLSQCGQNDGKDCSCLGSPEIGRWNVDSFGRGRSGHGHDRLRRRQRDQLCAPLPRRKRHRDRRHAARHAQAQRGGGRRARQRDLRAGRRGVSSPQPDCVAVGAGRSVHGPSVGWARLHVSDLEIR